MPQPEAVVAEGAGGGDEDDDLHSLLLPALRHLLTTDDGGRHDAAGGPGRDTPLVLECLPALLSLLHPNTHCTTARPPALHSPHTNTDIR